MTVSRKEIKIEGHLIDKVKDLGLCFYAGILKNYRKSQYNRNWSLPEQAR